MDGSSSRSAWMAVLSALVMSACGGDLERAPKQTALGDVTLESAASSRPPRPPPTCFAQDPAVTWMRGHAGAQVPGASQKLPTGFALCSDALGLASGVDNYHWVGQPTASDFTLTAALTRLDAGQASVIFAPQQGAVSGPRLRITVAKAGKGLSLTAASRSALYASEVVLASKSVSRLPVTLSVKRVDSLLQVLADTGTGLKLIASVQADSGELATSGFAMLTQGSGAVGNFAQAAFERVTFVAAPEKTEGECTEGFVATMGAPLRIFGSDLGRVKDVTIGGQPAPIASRADNQLVVTMPTVQGAATTVMLRTATAEHYVPAALAVERAGPTPPSLSLIVDANGRSVTELRAGDDAYLEGHDLPAPGAARLWLGSTEATIEADSTPLRLHLRVGEVSADEAGCPRFFVASGAPADNASFGDVYSVRQSFAPHLCPTLVAGTASGTATATATTRIAQSTSRDGTLTVSIPSSLTGGEQLSILWSATASKNASRGSRLIEVEVPRLLLGTAQDRYRETLGALGKVLEDAINGGGDEGLCGCEVDVTANADAGTLVLAPCVALPVEPEEPEPAVPGLPTDLESNKQIWSLLGLKEPYLPGPPNCNEASPVNNPRHYSWCAFMRMVFEINGKPRFEDLVPLKKVAAQNDATPAGVPEPMQRELEDKTVLMEPGMASRYVSLGYANPCGMAARSAYCLNWDSHWMPRFKTEDRMVKLFWAREHELGSGIDKSKLYSYQPPGDPLFYLVGMHIAVARFDGLEYGTSKGYFRWITLWVPTASDFKPRYNQNCGANHGHNFDKPEALEGTKWGEFVMCSEVDGFTKCGNPWGPPDECNVNSVPGCANCHAAIGRVPDEYNGSIAAGWLFQPALLSPQIETCHEQIAGGQDYSGLMECSWAGAGLGSDPFLD